MSANARRYAWLLFCTAAAAGALLSGCGKLNLGGGPSPSPTASASASPTPGACNTPAVYTPNIVLVAMASAISAVSVPTYGTISGYSVVNVAQGTYPDQAMVINQYTNSAGKTVPITSNNMLQFTNVETGSSIINHSAVGFKGEAFPAIPYAFPSPAALPTGTTVSHTASWSTGRVQPLSYSPCASQVFKLTPGVYYFGDYDYYNTANFRDVLVVATPSVR